MAASQVFKMTTALEGGDLILWRIRRYEKSNPTGLIQLLDDICFYLPESHSREEAVIEVFNRYKKKAESAALSAAELVHLFWLYHLMAEDNNYELAAQLIVAAMTPRILRDTDPYEWFISLLPPQYFDRWVPDERAPGKKIFVEGPKPSIDEMLDGGARFRHKLTRLLSKSIKRYRVEQTQLALKRAARPPPPEQLFATSDVFAYAFTRIPSSSLRPDLTHEVVWFTFFCYTRDTGGLMFLAKADQPHLLERNRPAFPNMSATINTWQAEGAARWSEATPGAADSSHRAPRFVIESTAENGMCCCVYLHTHHDLLASAGALSPAHESGNIRTADWRNESVVGLDVDALRAEVHLS
jgi:hypothetical protein